MKMGDKLTCDCSHNRNGVCGMGIPAMCKKSPWLYHNFDTTQYRKNTGSVRRDAKTGRLVIRENL